MKLQLHLALSLLAAVVAANPIRLDERQSMQEGSLLLLEDDPANPISQSRETSSATIPATTSPSYSLVALLSLATW